MNVRTSPAAVGGIVLFVGFRSRAGWWAEMKTVLVAGLGMDPMRLVGVAFFVGFFVAAGIAIRYASTPYVRKGFLAGFFALLLVVATVGPVQPLPLIQWHKFSHPVPETQSQYQLRVVDGDGRELQYDVAATLAVDGAYLHRYLDDFVEADAAEQRRVGSYLVDRANVHKAQVQDPPLTRPIRYPPGYVRERWTPEKVSQYGQFVGLRVYEITTTTTPDGREVTNVEEELVFEQFYDGSASASLADDDAESATRHDSISVAESPRIVRVTGGGQGVGT